MLFAIKALTLTIALPFALFALDAAIGQENSQQVDLPPIGKWLLHENGEPSHWFGETYQNRKLFEPINVIFIDAYAETEKAAVEKLMRECKIAGYDEERGHSSGYAALIGERQYGQIPNDKRMAFANKDFFLTNNHGRIMGPVYDGRRYVFVGAFSTESFKIFDRAHHRYVSFIRARDDFCAKMDKGSVYKIAGSHDLANTVDDREFTTGDHDGKAIILSAIN
jgi:hypothetical protein